MFEEIDSVLNTKSAPSNISYKSFKSWNFPTMITETLIVSTRLYIMCQVIILFVKTELHFYD